MVHPMALPPAVAAALVVVDGCLPSNAQICRLGAWQTYAFSRVFAIHPFSSTFVYPLSFCTFVLLSFCLAETPHTLLV